jgi:predicted Fe-Mo cluster-binding NifX family protein
MRIAVSSSGEGLEASVDPRFGRAAAFVVHDTESSETRTIDNSSGEGAAHGAGVQAAETMSRIGADCIATGHCGPKAFAALSAAGITVYTGASGTVAEAVEAVVHGRLSVASSPDAPGGR